MHTLKVYKEFMEPWQSTRTQQLMKLLKLVLGEDCTKVPASVFIEISFRNFSRLLGIRSVEIADRTAVSLPNKPPEAPRWFYLEHLLMLLIVTFLNSGPSCSKDSAKPSSHNEKTSVGRVWK